MKENDLKNVFVNCQRHLLSLNAPSNIRLEDGLFRIESFDVRTCETIRNEYVVRDWVVTTPDGGDVSQFHILQDSCNFVRGGKIRTEDGNGWFVC